MTVLLRGSLLLLAFAISVECFIPPTKQFQVLERQRRRSFLLRSTDDDDDRETTPFFTRLVNKFRKPQEEERPIETADESTAKVTAAVISQETPPETTAPSAAVQQPTAKMAPSAPLSPEEQAARLRAEAEKMRLEAERMDAELTLRKIARLEQELQHAKKKEDPDEMQNILREMEALQLKLEPKSSKSSSSVTPSVVKSVTASKSTTYTSDYLSNLKEPFDPNDFDELFQYVQSAPSFLKKSMATTVDMEYDSVDDINSTELAIKLDQLSRLDFSFSKRPKPSFTMAQIEKRKEELKNNEFAWSSEMTDLPAEIRNNETAMALLSLEYEHYIEGEAEKTINHLEKILEGEDVLQEFVNAFNKSEVDNAIEQFFPKCTRKEGQGPTIAQVQQLVGILPKAGFQPAGKPEPVAGGFVVRGINKKETGDALITSIDEQLGKASLSDKITVVYTYDFTLFGDKDRLDDMVDPDEVPPILYIMGPDIAREPRRIALSIVSALGLATSWYLSIYPFLLNPSISKRVEEALALADANMVPDLNWLTDLSYPLFLTFVGIQLLHELGHQVVGRANGVKMSVPTFVPSIITGITSSVTTFKSPPKNKNAMFDVAVAGPLVGIIASCAAIAIGSQLTMTSDPSLLPSLPLEILRQSTLGGGIINTVIGNDVLGVPDGALGTQAVAQMTIPLHPIAVAGYISLVVNGLSLLPIGTTDGGRVALTLFGRGAKLLIGNTFLLSTFLIGLVGSDLFLFYFAFLAAFQTGNEIPARNEYDKVGLERVVVAASAFVLVALTLVPFQ